MLFFFPDSQDLVDPTFDFERETRNGTRLRQRDDEYAHEVFTEPPYDGLLISRAIVEGAGGSGRFTLAQRQRLNREGGRAFFRLDGRAQRLSLMADCGAFSYVNEETPPYSVDDVLDFYKLVDCDFGISVDHVILAYNTRWDASPDLVPDDVKKRQAITLDLAASFLKSCEARRLRLTPLGVAQGWSPRSYADAVVALQKMGYRYVAVGGLVPLKTREILEVLAAIKPALRSDTRLHLLGVTRPESVSAFAGMGVASFDSTSPLRQAFKDGVDNYYTLDRTYTAIRVPQVEGNARLRKAIRAGRIPQERARDLERGCLAALRRFDAGEGGVEETVSLVHAYDELVEPGKDYRDRYRDTLRDRPWQACPCSVCRRLGHHVVLFRGAERNRRRGFHNLWITRERLRRLGAVRPDGMGQSAVVEMSGR